MVNVAKCCVNWCGPGQVREFWPSDVFTFIIPLILPVDIQDRIRVGDPLSWCCEASNDKKNERWKVRDEEKKKTKREKVKYESEKKN